MVDFRPNAFFLERDRVALELYRLLGHFRRLYENHDESTAIEHPSQNDHSNPAGRSRCTRHEHVGKDHPGSIAHRNITPPVNIKQRATYTYGTK